jgi:prophage DNA circulation protein
MTSATECSLGNFQLSIFDITDNVQDSLIKYEFINRDGALLVDMGKKARTIKFKTYWYGVVGSTGNTSSSQLDTANNFVYQQHIRFLDLLEENSLQTFIHPKYGIVNVRVESFNIFHDDRLNYVEVDVNLVEDIININNGALPANFSNISSWKFAMDSSIASATAKIQSSNYANILNKPYSSIKSIFSQVQNAATSIKNLASSIDSNLVAFNGVISSITTPFTTVSNATSNLLDLPTLIGDALNSGVQSILSAASITGTGGYYVSSAINSFKTIGKIWSGPAAVFIAPMWNSIAAGNVINGFGSTVTSDVNLRQTVDSILNTASFDSAGNLVNTNIVNSNIMTQDQLKQAMNQLRTYANTAINGDPPNYSIKNAIKGLQTYVNQIQFRLFTTNTVTVNQQSIFSILQSLGQDYKNVGRTLALNTQITNPNFVSGTVTYYV